ncbi:MAG: phospholipid/cholesterol/gamma-HCH transport system substrate-binding protein [Thermoleophilaceae bacterium]|jgi:phospholipid/cholesterol/gamma-HCH transport system substrate-binding protein|nr:phospholipid/cholesterol/gamma-HCH transport system substrate-binding protein [Thermoleophilaceae bacterium]MEA2408117.1 phospholipid/cholesterol/gamma-HCH transport system substrate-binding protein [Thermoleophilaceae bacterium]
MRRVGGSRFSPYQVGLIALVLILVATYLGASKDIPFTTPFQLKATFENAPPIHKGQAVRIAGVEVGKVSGVEPMGGDSPAVLVTMKLKDEALPIHKDAQIKVRPRLFFEGNLFFDIRPGTPSAGDVEDGDTIPVTQTSAPVQLDQVLGTLKTDTRKDLQKLLIGYGDAINGRPKPGEDADQDPATRGQTAGQSLNDSLRDSAQALRGGAVLNDATLGTDLHDLSKLIGSQQKIFAALSSRESSLKDLITNFNTTMGALAAEETNLRATIHELPLVLEAARPALDNLNAAFPSTRAWALEMIPGVRETPATIEAGFPWIRQVRALVSPAELQGLVDDLQPAVSDFAEFTDGQVDLLPVLDDFNRCQLHTILPTIEQRIDEGALSTGLRNYEEFFQSMVSLAGESQNFDGNGSFARIQAGGGYAVQTPPIGAQGPFHSSAAEQPLGTRPAKSPKPPYRPNVKCHTQPVPDLSDAPIGGGP